MDNNKEKQKSGNSLFGGKRSSEVCSAGPSGIFRQNNDTEKSTKTGALSSYARVARQSIGGISQLISRKINTGDNSPNTPWPNNKDDYDVLEVIGQGATAMVHKAFCKPREEKCAIKKINLETWNMPMEELLKEIQAMSNCNHENVVSYYTSFVVDEELWLIMKLLEGGSLLDIIKQLCRNPASANGVMDEITIATVLKEVLKGLEYFHSNGQIHRDIKAGNILLGDEGDIQIADFGVSSWLALGRDISRPAFRNTFVGTPCWMAPEVMEQDRGYDFKADIWSFGITAIELATGIAPYHKYPPMKVLMLTLQNDPPTLDTSAECKDQYKNYSKLFRKMITDCLQKNPRDRPNAQQLLQHPFFKKSKDKKTIAQYFAPITEDVKKMKLLKSTKYVRSPASENLLPSICWDYDDDDDSEDFFLTADGVVNNNNNVSKNTSLTNGDLIKQPTRKNNKEMESLNCLLRIRNTKGLLDDIRFEFMLEKDEPSNIATELKNAGLIDPIDENIITKNLSELINNEKSNSVVFQLESSLTSPSQSSEELFLGFAKIFIVD